MKPDHLQIQFTRESGSLNVQWFGPSAMHAAGSAHHALRPGIGTTLVPDPYLFDLRPLLAEIAAGTISDAEDFQAADEFLMLRDLLADDDFEQLCETLYHFLWREAQQGLTLEGVQRGADGKIWIDPDRRLVRVWFATDRKPVQFDDVVERFDSVESADCITYGVCNVFIPESHKPGSTGMAWWRRWIRLEADDSLEVHGIHALPRDVLWAGLANKLETWWHPGQRNLFVLIHGFNVSFEEAAMRAAQIGYDLKVPGEMAFYSWPSHGSTAAYSADEATISASVPHIGQFLHELSERSGAARIHLFVHSMGNRGFLRSLERLVAVTHVGIRGLPKKIELTSRFDGRFREEGRMKRTWRTFNCGAKPAAYGAAVSFGPNTSNFRDVVALLRERDAAVVVADRQQLAAFVRRCLAEPRYADELGRRARQLVLEQAGAAGRTCELLQSLMVG